MAGWEGEVRQGKKGVRAGGKKQKVAPLSCSALRLCPQTWSIDSPLKTLKTDQISQQRLGQNTKNWDIRLLKIIYLTEELDKMDEKENICLLHIQYREGPPLCVFAEAYNSRVQCYNVISSMLK